MALLESTEDMLRLTDRLSRCENVTRLDTPEEPQGWTLAYHLSHLEESFHAFLDRQLPRLLDESLTNDEVLDALFDIGDELRHVVYHLRDARFFQEYTGLEPEESSD